MPVTQNRADRRSQGQPPEKSAGSRATVTESFPKQSHMPQERFQWALKRYQRRTLETVPVETKGLLLSGRGFIFAKTHQRDNDGLSTEYG